MKIAYVDVETTGRKHWRHSIHQIGLILEINGQVELEHQWDCQPYIAADIEPEALKMSKKSMVHLEHSLPAPVIHNTIKEHLRIYINADDPTDKFMICGYNCAKFDIPFLEAWWMQCGDEGFWNNFWTGPLDVIALAAQYLREERKLLSSFSQESVAKYLNISPDPEQLHTALYDARLCREIYHTITYGGITSSKESEI